MQTFYRYFAYLLAYLNLAMIGFTLQQVIARYFFNSSSIAIQELQWHLFGSCFLLGGALALRANEHVRVDIFYGRFSSRGQAFIDLIAMLIFVIPSCLLLIYFGYLDVEQARSFPNSIDTYRLTLWFQESWKDSWIYNLETIFLEYVLKGESSANPGGLPARWIIKSILPLSSLLLLLEATRISKINFVKLISKTES